MPFWTERSEVNAEGILRRSPSDLQENLCQLCIGATRWCSVLDPPEVNAEGIRCAQDDSTIQFEMLLFWLRHYPPSQRDIWALDFFYLDSPSDSSYILGSVLLLVRRKGLKIVKPRTHKGEDHNRSGFGFPMSVNPLCVHHVVTITIRMDILWRLSFFFFSCLHWLRQNRSTELLPCRPYFPTTWSCNRKRMCLSGVKLRRVARSL